MNNPAAKEPSMDEILSSIRQIIADEDQPGKQSAPAAKPASASGAPAPASEKAADAAMLAAAPAAAAAAAAAPAAAPAVEPEPLALSEEQMIAQPGAGSGAGPGAKDDETAGISFSPEVQQAPIAAPPVKEKPAAEQIPAGTDDAAKSAPPSGAVAEPAAPQEQEPVAPQPSEEIELVVADDVAFDESEAGGEVSRSQPMPDPDLSAEMAETLLAPTTDAATRHAFSKLNALSMGGSDLTLEAIVRDMLRPMLKEWLDENLPATVERMVEKEIERVSRGG